MNEHLLACVILTAELAVYAPLVWIALRFPSVQAASPPSDPPYPYRSSPLRAVRLPVVVQEPDVSRRTLVHGVLYLLLSYTPAAHAELRLLELVALRSEEA